MKWLKAISLLSSCWIILSVFDEVNVYPSYASSSQSEAPRWAVGMGAYFLEPREISGAAGTGPTVEARPVFLLNTEHRIEPFSLKGFRWEPGLGVFLPRSAFEGVTSYSGFLNSNFGYFISQRWLAILGLGFHLNIQASKAQRLAINGDFVTPATTSTSWVFTTNLGTAFWMDSNFKLNLQMVFSRILSSANRKTRFLVGVTYAF